MVTNTTWWWVIYWWAASLTVSLWMVIGGAGHSSCAACAMWNGEEEPIQGKMNHISLRGGLLFNTQCMPCLFASLSSRQQWNTELGWRAEATGGLQAVPRHRQTRWMQIRQAPLTTWDPATPCFSSHQLRYIDPTQNQVALENRICSSYNWQGLNTAGQLLCPHMNCCF